MDTLLQALIAFYEDIGLTYIAILLLLVSLVCAKEVSINFLGKFNVNW